MKNLINLLTPENIDINVKSSNEFGRINIDGSFAINGKKTVFHIYQTEYLSDTMNDWPCLERQWQSSNGEYAVRVDTSEDSSEILLRFAGDLDQVREVLRVFKPSDITRV